MTRASYVGPLTPAMMGHLRGAIRVWTEDESQSSFSGSEAACGDRVKALVMEPKTADVALFLTAAEARGLLALAGDGAEGILNDPAAAKAYVGTKASIAAAETAMRKLSDAIYQP